MPKNTRRPKKGTFANQYKPPPTEEGLDWDMVMHHGIPPHLRGEPLAEDQQLSLDDIDRRNRGLTTEYNEKGEQVRKPKDRRVKNPGIGRGRHQVIDMDLLVKLYTEDHMLPRDIAPLVGLKTDTTVVKYLKRAGVYEPNKYKLGSPHYKGKIPARRSPESYEAQRKGYCINGHDLDKHGSPRWKKGPGGVRVSNGRECLMCAQDRLKELRKKNGQASE